MQSTAEVAEPFLAHGEDKGEGPAQRVGDLLHDIDGHRDRGGVVADPGPVQPAVPLNRIVRDISGENGVDVSQERERRTPVEEPPDEVAHTIPLAVSWGVGKPTFQPFDT
jgi:hypothetical protein